MSAPRQMWTTREVAIMRQHYSALPGSDLVALLGHRRSLQSIRSMARRLDIAPSNPWTTREVARLRESYGAVPTDDLAEEFGRTATAVRQMAHRLGVGRKNHRSLQPVDRETIEREQSARAQALIAATRREIMRELGRL